MGYLLILLFKCFFQSDLFADMREQRAFLETTGHPLQIPKNFSEFTEICRFFFA